MHSKRNYCLHTVRKKSCKIQCYEFIHKELHSSVTKQIWQKNYSPSRVSALSLCIHAKAEVGKLVLEYIPQSFIYQ